MASYTPNLNLLMKDPVADGADTFNIETMLNQNWEKIDRQVLLAMAAAAAYDAGTTYRKGDFCSQGGLLHRANQDIAQPEAWTAGHWATISITDVIRGLTAADVGAAPKSFFHTQEIDVYVAKTGSDATGTGTQERPFLTIQKAIDTFPRIQTGKVRIHISPGRYEENIIIYSLPGAALLILDAPGGSVQIRSVYLGYCSAYVTLENLNFYGNADGTHHPSIYAESCRYVLLNGITCTGVPEVQEDLAAVTASWGTVLFVWNSTISNKSAALDCMASTVYLNNGVTGENNKVAIRCGTGYGSFGGIVFKGGATIAGSEQTAFGGQIFD